MLIYMFFQYLHTINAYILRIIIPNKFNTHVHIFCRVVSVQPGCLDPSCSHARAWELYAETVYPGNENHLLAVKCNSILSLDTGACPGKAIPLGYACPRTAKGNYFLKTNDKFPFGKNL